LPDIVEMIVAMVREDGPICTDRLMHRIASLWRISRIGHTVESVLRTAIARAIQTGNVTRRGRFLYAVPERNVGIRTNKNAHVRRQPDEIAPEEYAAAADVILRTVCALPESDLIVSIARVFGFQRAGEGVRTAVREGITLLVRSGKASNVGGQVAPVGEPKTVI